MSLSIVFEDGGDAELAGDPLRMLADEVGALGFEDLANEVWERAKKHANFQVDEESLPRIARALDHLRNAAPAEFESVPRPHADDLIAARNECLVRLGISPLTYRLRSWEFGGEDRTFWSYTGSYEKGDRLVDGSGEPMTVLSVELQATPIEDGVLVVERAQRRR